MQEFLAGKRDLELPRMLGKRDCVGPIIIDDLGYLPQETKEAD